MKRSIFSLCLFLVACSGLTAQTRLCLFPAGQTQINSTNCVEIPPAVLVAMQSHIETLPPEGPQTVRQLILQHFRALAIAVLDRHPPAAVQAARAAAQSARQEADQVLESEAGLGPQ